MADFVTALGLAIVIEGVCYALFPDGMKKMMLQVLDQPPQTLRAFGIGAAAAGLFIVWMMRG